MPQKTPPACLTIQVTQEDITRCQDNPVSRALFYSTNARRVEVRDGFARLSRKHDYWRVTLPRHICRWLADWSSGKQVDPVAFEIRIPRRWHPPKTSQWRRVDAETQP